jgi:hypothetical protein
MFCGGNTLFLSFDVFEAHEGVVRRLFNRRGGTSVFSLLTRALTEALASVNENNTSFVDAVDAVHSIHAVLFTLKSSRQLFLVRLGFLLCFEVASLEGKAASYSNYKRWPTFTPPLPVVFLERQLACQEIYSLACGSFTK